MKYSEPLPVTLKLSLQKNAKPFGTKISAYNKYYNLRFL